MRTFRIELKVDFDGEEKEKIMRDAVINAARQLITTSALIADKRKPQIMVQTRDFYSGDEEILITEDIENGA